MLGFEAAMPQFEALGAQVVGVSTDPAPSLAAWQKENNAGGKQILLSDFPRRQMLTAYGALETNEQSPVYRYAKRAYFIIDKTGTVKYIKIMDSPLNLLSADEVLKALKDSGAAWCGRGGLSCSERPWRSSPRPRSPPLTSLRCR
jgi:peroxiredoxin